ALRVVLQAPRVAHRVAQGLAAVIEAVLDALAEQPAETALQILRQIAPDAVPPQRQRQARLPLPPLPEVHHLEQPEVALGELPFVDDHARPRLPRLDDV